MLLSDGIVTIYRQEITSSPGDMPKYEWIPFWRSYFGNKTVGITRYYTAMEHNDQVDLLIEVQRNTKISAATDRAEIDGIYYRITQVQHLLDDDGLPMTDLSLERIGALDD